MSLSEVLPVHLATREETGFELREGEIDYQWEWWSRLQKEVYSKKTTCGCKGYQFSLRGPDMGNKEVQPIRGLKNMEGSGRDGTKS